MIISSKLPSLAVAILRTCKQVGEEATPILYGKNAFDICLRESYPARDPITHHPSPITHHPSPITPSLTASSHRPRPRLPVLQIPLVNPPCDILHNLHQPKRAITHPDSDRYCLLRAQLPLYRCRHYSPLLSFGFPLLSCGAGPLHGFECLKLGECKGYEGADECNSTGVGGNDGFERPCGCCTAGWSAYLNSASYIINRDLQ
jgi:hypothetical protein